MKVWACAWVSNIEPKQTKPRSNLENSLFISGVIYANDIGTLSGFLSHTTQFAPVVPSGSGAAHVEWSGDATGLDQRLPVPPFPELRYLQALLRLGITRCV